MKKIGFIGVGNMGGRMAKNILEAGYEVTAFDVRSEPVEDLVKLGARKAETPRTVGENSDVVFVMVMNGDQIKAILDGPSGLLGGLRAGATLICTATILRSEMIEIGKILDEKGINVIDSPVSGGAPGAEAGTLTMMVACSESVLDNNRELLEIVGQNIYHVGEDIGMGQTVKAALAALTGVTYAGIFEALILGVKAGVKPEVLQQVVGTSVVGNFLFRDTSQNIIDRNFKGQSNIGTMFKDLGIARSMAKDCGVPLFTTSVAYELFQAGKATNPEEDNWTIIKILENIVGVTVGDDES